VGEGVIAEVGQADCNDGSDQSVGLGLENEPDPYIQKQMVGPLIGSGVRVSKESIIAGPVIVALDNLILKTRDKVGGGVNCSELSEEESIGSSSQHISDTMKPAIGKSNVQVQRKSPIPLVSLLGPNCMHFAEVVNNNSCLVRRRNGSGTQESGVTASESISTEIQQRNESGDEEVSIQKISDQGAELQSPGSPILEVVLPFQQINQT
jgi:hypothetical protein